MAERPRILVVGVGGLGCPAALVLARAGANLTLVDDDEVELNNLHRQLLFDEADVGTPKLEAAKRALLKSGAKPDQLRLVASRILPENALELISEADIVVEGADNFATKFLTADACQLTGTPVVHGAGIRFSATVWAVGRSGRPCYRCLFEDVPAGAQQNCDSAGVMGPVVGFAGALMADLALRLAAADDTATGSIWTYDGWQDRLRAVSVKPRTDCELCGPNRNITSIQAARYLSPPTSPADVSKVSAPLA